VAVLQLLNELARRSTIQKSWLACRRSRQADVGARCALRPGTAMQDRDWEGAPRPRLFRRQKGGKRMNITQRERKAGAGGTIFTALVVLAIIACIGLLLWRAGSGEAPNGPPPSAQAR
jgi:hypothetical protein